MWIWSHREILWVIEIFLVYQNSLQLKLEVKNVKPEVVLKKHIPILWTINLNIDRLGRSINNDYNYCFSEKVIILLFKDGGGRGLCCYNPRQKCKQFQTKPWSFCFVFDPIPLYIFSLILHLWSIKKGYFLNFVWLQSNVTLLLSENLIPVNYSSFICKQPLLNLFS